MVKGCTAFMARIDARHTTPLACLKYPYILMRHHRSEGQPDCKRAVCALCSCMCALPAGWCCWHNGHCHLALHRRPVLVKRGPRSNDIPHRARTAAALLACQPGALLDGRRRSQCCSSGPVLRLGAVACEPGGVWLEAGVGGDADRQCHERWLEGLRAAGP